MFNNLTESRSHVRELKRRGSFVLFITTTYALLFIVAGVISIYAYDARLEEPAGQIIVVNPVDLEIPKADAVKAKSRPPWAAITEARLSVRTRCLTLTLS